MRNNRRKVFRILQFIAVSFFLLAPLIKTSNGYSLIGFDVDLLRLYFFNTIITFDNFFLASILILLSVLVFIMLTQILGRVWCGWLCPQSFFTKSKIDIAGKFSKKYQKSVGILLAFLFALILSLNWMFYFISPTELFNNVVTDFGSISTTIWLIIFIILFFDFAFAGFLWCRYVCPYAKMQFVMTDNGTLYVGLLKGQENNCINCNACVKKCLAKIDPRKTPDNACVYCETCIVTCERVLSKKGGHSVIGYIWGSDNKFSIKRTNLLITFAIIILLSIIAIYNVIESTPISIKYENLTTDNNKTYSSIFTIRNGMLKNTVVTFSSDESITITPLTISLKAKETKNIPVKITSKTINNLTEIIIEASTSEGFKNKIYLKKN